MEDIIGTRIDRYLILERIGEGGMAVVYKALNTRLDSQVAMKLIRTERLAPEIAGSALKRFEREAKSLAQLTHSNIVGVMDYGDYRNQPYLVMEFLGGGSLKKFMGTAMPWQESVRLLLPVAHALQYVHKHNIIHRDIKPSNILFTESGQPMLADFGIAKILEEEVTIDLTGTGGAIGTPEYMSPEQGLGKAIDARSDIYSLGVVFYELVTGRKPFLGDTPLETLFKHVNAPLPKPSAFVRDLPSQVEQILLCSLAKNRDDRYPTMDDFAQALENAPRGKRTGGWGPTSTPTGAPPKPARDPVARKLWTRMVNGAKAGAAATGKSGRKLGTVLRRTWGWLLAGALGLSALAVVLVWLRTAPPTTVVPVNPLAGPSGIYYTSELSGNMRVFYYDPVKQQQIVLPKVPSGAWSAVPDNRGNLFFVAGTGGDIDIRILRADGTEENQTTTQGRANSWSPMPDGRGYLYFVSDRSGDVEIHQLNLATGESDNVTETRGPAKSWSPAPDGHGNLYYVSDRSGEVDIYRFSPGSSVPDRMTTTLGPAASWSPAPDGVRYLYFVSDRYQGIDIWRLDLSTGKSERVTETQGSANSWSPMPDGKGNFYFISDRSGETRLYKFDNTTKESTPIAIVSSSAASWLMAPEDIQIRPGQLVNAE